LPGLAITLNETCMINPHKALTEKSQRFHAISLAIKELEKLHASLAEYSRAVEADEVDKLIQFVKKEQKEM